MTLTNKKNLMLVVLFFSQSIHPQSNFEWVTSSIKDAATSDFALKVYASVIAGVGTHVAISLVDPGLYKLRKITRTLTPQEMQIDLAYKKQLLEIDEAKFQLTAVKRQALQEGFPAYKKNIQRKIDALSASDISEDEKQKAISALQEKIKETKAKMRDTTNSIFEQMLTQAE